MTGAHFLLTYACSYECDHCFVHAGPHAGGTFTIGQIRDVLDELVKIGTITTVYLEGGEPFQYYALMREGVARASERGFDVGIVTNAYWATTEEDAELWLRDLAALGLSRLTVSEGSLHFGDSKDTPARRALAAAGKLGVPHGSICTERPATKTDDEGRTVVDGGVMFRGRAAEKLTDGMPRRPAGEFTACTREQLAEPGRVHLDAYGNVHVCQGISMGNMWDVPLSKLAAEYDAASHPICGPLLSGGPVGLAGRYGVALDDGYVDECHLCYVARRALLDRFPAHLAPRQVYGLA